jgi:hypothetical protein
MFQVLQTFSHGSLLRKTRARSRVPITTTGARAGAAGRGTRTGAGSRHLRRTAGGVQCCG